MIIWDYEPKLVAFDTPKGLKYSLLKEEDSKDHKYEIISKFKDDVTTLQIPIGDSNSESPTAEPKSLEE